MKEVRNIMVKVFNIIVPGAIGGMPIMKRLLDKWFVHSEALMNQPALIFIIFLFVAACIGHLICVFCPCKDLTEKQYGRLAIVVGYAVLVGGVVTDTTLKLGVSMSQAIAENSQSVVFLPILAACVLLVQYIEKRQLKVPSGEKQK